MSKRVVCLTAFTMLAAPAAALAQSLGQSEDDVEVSYIYAAVMGSGRYKITDRTISMFRFPFSWSQREPTETSPGWRWQLPVVIGYDDLSNIQSDWIDAVLPSQLVTLAALPGFEYQYPVTANWQLKPFAQIGGGRDFSADETILMASIGLRSLSIFEIGEHWQLRWGNSVRWAGESQAHSGKKTRFSVLDTGIDFRRRIPISLADRPVDIGVYYIYQRYLPSWRSSTAPDLEQKTIDLHEIGLSMGLSRPLEILGISFQRVRLGYKSGGSFSGWTFGTEFPF